MNIEGKVAVLTGAGNGIGAALARQLAARGAKGVVVSDLDEDAAGSVSAGIVQSGGRAIGMRVDVSREADIQAMVAEAERHYGPVDILCSNAGLVDEGGADAPDALWQRSWSVNVMAHVYAARAVLPTMRRRGSGYLVSTCSAAGLLTSPGAAPYATTKHAAVALAEWLAIEHGDAGVRVSVICPQAVRTKLLEDSIAAGNAASRAMAQQARMLEPDDVARCAIEGIEQERFLILPHPEVQEHMQRKAQDLGRWLSGMRRFLAQARAPRTSGHAG